MPCAMTLSIEESIWRDVLTESRWLGPMASSGLCKNTSRSGIGEELTSIAAECQAAVHGYDLAGYVVIRLQKQTHDASDVFGPAEARNDALLNKVIILA